MTPPKSFAQRLELQEAPRTHSRDERDRSSFAPLSALEQALSNLGWNRISPDGEFVWSDAEFVWSLKAVQEGAKTETAQTTDAAPQIVSLPDMDAVTPIGNGLPSGNGTSAPSILSAMDTEH